MKNGITIIILVIISTALLLGYGLYSATETKAQQEIAKGKYEQASDLIEEDHFVEAIEIYKEIIDQHEGTIYADLSKDGIETYTLILEYQSLKEQMDAVSDN